MPQKKIYIIENRKTIRVKKAPLDNALMEINRLNGYKKDAL